MRLLDTFRRQRNVADHSGEIVEPGDVREALAAASALLADVKAWLAKNHPELS